MALVKQHHQLRCGERVQECVRRGPPPQRAGGEAAHTQPEANAVIDDQLESCTRAVPEDEQSSRERILLQRTSTEPLKNPALCGNRSDGRRAKSVTVAPAAT